MPTRLSLPTSIVPLAADPRWVGPYQLRHLLENCMNADHPWPPENDGVYIVSGFPWIRIPTKDSDILYSGGNTSNSPLFLTRVGSLIADMLGFWWHHSGGQSIYDYCKEQRLHPLDLYLGWVEGVPCRRCAEREVYAALGRGLCKRAPARCRVHSTPLKACLPTSA